jgi:hypothetical protein
MLRLRFYRATFETCSDSRKLHSSLFQLFPLTLEWIYLREHLLFKEMKETTTTTRYAREKESNEKEEENDTKNNNR